MFRTHTFFRRAIPYDLIPTPESMTSNIEEGPIHICSRCNTQFSSRNKLFRHLKIAKCQSDNLLDDTSGLRRYVIGGRHRNKTLASCEYYSFAEGCWKIGPELQEHRGSHGATTVQGTSTIYTLSGGGMHGNLLSCERLHLNKSSDADCSWSFAAPMAASMPKHALAVCSFESDESSWIYAVGGWACCSECDFYLVFNIPFPWLLSEFLAHGLIFLRLCLN